MSPVQRKSNATQIEAITEALLKETGSKTTRVSQKALDDQSEVIAKGYDALFQKNVFPKLGQAEKDALSDAIKRVPEVQDVMAKSPTLAKIHTALQSPNPVKISAKDLHRAYTEIGQAAGGRSQAAGEVRGLISQYIEKGLGPKGAEQFRTLNGQYGALEDLKRVWSQGSGQGPGGTIRPSQLEEWAGKHPGDSAVGRAGGMVRGLGIQDYRPKSQIPLGFSGIPAELISEIPGVGYLNKSLVNSPDAVKRTVEALRLSGRLGPREYAEFQGE